MSEILLDAEGLAQTLAGLADELNEEFDESEALALVGVRTRGSVLAERLAGLLSERGRAVEVGHVDVTLYRDDLAGAGGRKAIQASDLPFDLTGRGIVLVDDVFSTGRTVRAALTELMDFGRPAYIRLLCLVDRGGRELPIQPDFVGKEIDVAEDRKVCLRVAELDEVDEVVTE